MDPDPDQPQVGPAALPATVPTLLTNDNIHNILILLSTNMHELTDHVLILTTQVTNYTNAAPATVAATRPKLL